MMSTDDLSETEYGILSLALIKCQLLNNIVDDGKFKLCVISKDHINEAMRNGYITTLIPFGFPRMSDEEEMKLIMKLKDYQQIAWLKEQNGENK